MWDYINPRQYAAYKEWLEKVEKAEYELFWKDDNLYESDKQYYDFVNYIEELDLLDYLWYIEYVKDFYQRHSEDIYDYNREDYDYDDGDQSP
jgi:hypothetical protein